MSTYYLVSLWKSLITKDFFRILGNNHSFSHPYYQFFLSYIHRYISTTSVAFVVYGVVVTNCVAETKHALWQLKP